MRVWLVAERSEVEVAAVTDGAREPAVPQPDDGPGIEGAPTGGTGEVPAGVAAQHARMAGLGVGEGDEVDVGCLVDRAGVADRPQAVGVAGIVGGPTARRLEVAGGVIAQDDAMERGRPAGGVVHIAAIKGRAEVALGLEPAGVPGVERLPGGGVGEVVGGAAARCCSTDQEGTDQTGRRHGSTHGLITPRSRSGAVTAA